MKSSFFNPPEFLSLPVFGMSILQNSIKLVKLKQKKEGLFPVVAEEIYFKETCNYFSETLGTSECEELKKILKELKKKHKINFVQLSIPEKYTYVFEMPIPGDAISFVEDFIKNNIDQYAPMSAEEVSFDFKILKGHEGLETAPVVVTAIPKIIIEKYTAVLESCGIYVIACEPETHSIARCAIDEGDLSPYIIINIDEYSTTISVIEERLVQYTQTVSVGSQDLNKKISPENSALLKDTINKVIIYWFTSKDQIYQHAKIENVILTGKEIDSSDLVNFFESNLFVNVTFANVWKNCFDINTYLPSISRGESLKYAAAIGLSLSKIK